MKNTDLKIEVAYKKYVPKMPFCVLIVKRLFDQKSDKSFQEESVADE